MASAFAPCAGQKPSLLPLWEEVSAGRLTEVGSNTVDEDRPAIPLQRPGRVKRKGLSTPPPTCFAGHLLPQGEEAPEPSQPLATPPPRSPEPSRAAGTGWPAAGSPPAPCRSGPGTAAG